MSTIEERVKTVVCEQLQLSQAPEEIANDASFLDDLGADSLDTVELVMALEEAFDIEIADEVADDPEHSVIRQQAASGIPVRMAVLDALLGE